MRIIDGYSKLNQPAVESANQGAAARQSSRGAEHAGRAPASSAGESVTVSAAAHQAVANAEGAKLEKLRSAIADGTFKIDPVVIAKRIVEGG